MSSAEAAGLKYTPVDEIPQIVARLRKTFITNKTKPLEYRKNQLKSMLFAIKENEEAFKKAVNKDLGRSDFETSLAEFTTIVNEIVEAIHGLDKWAKDDKPWAGIAWATHGTVIRKEPKGTVLIIGAWNYPITLTVGPLIAAIAAGNTCILKPSEVSANTAKLLEQVLGKALDPETYATVNGAIPETTALLDERFEHILYTGNGTVGRIIQEKAAKWLCPVTLELGGKSPVIVDESAEMSIVAKRVMWGKSVNAGQTCIAPDYIVCTKATQDKLVQEFKKAAQQFWPNGSNATTKDYARIVNEGHWKRLASVLEGTKGTIVVGGETDQATKYIAPTIVANCTADDPLMAGELFGPILPIVPVASIDEAINFINARDQPLALYPFGNNAVVKRILDNTRSGGVVVGDVMLHYVVGQLPFGGTGPSGYGAYHGKTGFDTFSHQRSCLIAPHTGIFGSIVEKVMTMRYPPYTDANLAKFKALVGKRIGFSRPQNPHARITKF